MTGKTRAENVGQWLGGVVFLAGAGAVSAGLALSSSCSGEPPPRCAVPALEAIAALHAAGPPTTSGDAAPGSCDSWVPPGLQGLGSGAGCGANGCAPIAGDAAIAEAFGLETYFPNPDDQSWVDQPNSMAIKYEYVGVRIDDYDLNYLPNAAEGGLSHYPYPASPPPNPPQDGMNPNRPYSWGVFDTVYPVDGICTVHLSASSLIYPDVPAHAASQGVGTSPPGYGPSASCSTDSDCQEGGTAPCVGASPDAGVSGFCTDIRDQPRTQIGYEWSNVKVVMDSNIGSIGHQIFADLTISQDGCTQTFHASILAPRAQCDGTDDAGNTVADPSQCVANVSSTPDNYPVVGDASTKAQVYGSGLASQIPVVCASMFPPAAPADAMDGGPSPPPADFECLPTRTQPTFE